MYSCVFASLVILSSIVSQVQSQDGTCSVRRQCSRYVRTPPPPSPIGSNLALNKSTMLSSICWNGVASVGNDGIARAKCHAPSCVHSCVESTPYWRVDLETPTMVGSVELSNRHFEHCPASWCAPMTSFLEIRVGNSTTIADNALCFYYDDTMASRTTESFMCDQPLIGQYVSVQKVAGVPNKELVFTELRVLPPDGENLALNKPSTLSSTCNGGAASGGNDGFDYTINEDTNVFAQTCSEATPSWTVDLETSYLVGSVEITREDYTAIPCAESICGPQASFMEIRVGDNADISQNSVCYYYGGVMPAGAKELLQFANPCQGRYVSVQKVAGEPNAALVLVEVRVFKSDA